MSTDTDAHIIFQPSGRQGRFPLGTSLLKCAQKLGVDIDSICGGQGICGRCQINLIIGEFSKFQISSKHNNLSSFSIPEQKYKEQAGLKEGRRLSCHAKVLGDAVIHIPQESQVHKQVIRKEAKSHEITIDPAIRLYYLDVKAPNLQNSSGDLERLLLALNEQWGQNNIRDIEIEFIQSLQKTLRDGNWKVTASIYLNKNIIAIWPCLIKQVFGIALDIGTTTIAAHLCDLTTGEVLASDGIMNPQIRFGEDLMSRVAYIMMNPSSSDQITKIVRSGINKLIKRLRLQTGIEKNKILDSVVVCNPIMHHLLLGINPTELGTSPFALSTNKSITITAKKLSITEMNNTAKTYILPCIAGHVGADAAAVLLSETPHLSDEMTLIIDVGTNAEIILGNKNGLFAASAPTGPAFEGAQISCGQRAGPGAIEHVRIDPKTFEPRFQVINCNMWSDEEGFSDAIKETGVTGICGSGIIEILSEMYLVGLIKPNGLISEINKKSTDRIQKDGRTFRYLVYSGNVEISINQNDVRAIQLAKAALYASVQLLMDKIKIKTIDRVILAGAFGSNIDVLYAMILGMIPDCELSKVSAAGNAAGTGARIALLNKNARIEIESLVQKIQKIETAVEPMFQQYFINAMAIPHKVDRFPNLQKVIALPKVSEYNEPTTMRKFQSKQRRHRPIS